MKRLLLVLFVFIASQSWGQIISQYVETNSGTTPKGIEIWNNTTSTLNFSTNNLVIKKGTNGGTPSTDYTLSTGTLAPGKVIVIGTVGLHTVTNNNGSVYYYKGFIFNGDDALEVWYGSTKTDVFGNPGSDPGSSWSGNGVSTANQNIKLKPNITSGATSGWTDPSTRFETVSTNPSDTTGGGVSGFGLAPVYTWTGNSSSDWNASGNWDYGYVPGDVMNVNIPSGLATYPILSNDVSSPSKCSNLKIGSGASLTIPFGKAITIYGNLSIDASATPGTLTIVSDANGNGSLIVNGTVTGSATVQRYIAAYSAADNGWHEISSPVNAMAISGSGFEPGSSDDLYAWDEVNDIWSNYRQSDGSHPFSTFANGEGYLVAYSSTATKNFTGTLNNADITFSNLSYNTTQGNGWHLLGNPFSSALTWGDANWSLTNVGGVAKVWNESGGNYSDISSGGIIPSTNGFFVQVTNTTNSLTIPAADRVHNAANNYKSASAIRQAGTLQFKVTSDANGYYDESRLGFKPNATEGFDPAFDSHKLFTMVQTAPSLWTVSKKQDFSTDYIPEPATAYDVPLHFKPGVSTVYHLSVKGVDSFNGTSFVLEDLKTGDKIDLGTTKEYDFSAEKGDDPNRFVLHINGVTGIPDVDGTEGLHIFSYGKTIYLDSQKALNGKVTVYNLMGQKVYESPLNGTGKQQFRLDRQQGVYFVKVEEEGLTRTHKVFIK